MRYAILGTAQAENDHGTPIPLGGPKVRALLTALALRPDHPVPTPTLIDEIWADTNTPPTDAPAALQALVARLRRAIGKQTITSTPAGYRLATTPDAVDLFTFERLVREAKTALTHQDPTAAATTLREALALWRGPALSDLPDRTAATRPEALREEALRTRIEADLQLGRAPDVVPELRALTETHPYDEPLHALLIRALHDSGRTAEALTAYESLRRTLRDTLGTNPGGPLRTLHTTLLTPPRPTRNRNPEPSTADPRPGHTHPGTGAAEPGADSTHRTPDGPGAADAGSAHPGTDGADPGTGDLQPRPTDSHPRPTNTHPHLAGSHPRPTSLDPRTDDTHPRTDDTHPRAGRTSPRIEDTHRHPQDTHSRPEDSPPRPDDPHPSPEAPRPGNIRPRLTSFVGRELELGAIRSDLHRSRLVTLTGPGGSGKTRLAEEAAAGHPQAWLAELAPLDHPEAVPAAVVSALGLRETALITHERAAPQDDPVTLLVEHCAQRGGGMLLILDNCEHVIAAAAELAETLLTHCPGLTILATSREPLGVPGESVRPVEPLLPAPAHRLFADRAASARPDADTVLHADPEAVSEICHRLDGLPLAIELAAARLRLLTPRQIADRLDDRFRLLTSGSRTALPRQQTLRAVVDWSWDLLDEAERTLLREVSVFTGGWDLEAAEAVCTAGPAPTADILGALVDKSLITATAYPSYEHDARVMRYRMLETIHEYATERAAETPTLRAAAELRHRTWVLTLVDQAEPRLRSADQLPWIHRLETDLDNIRSAFHRTLTAADEPTATHLALSMGWFWWLRNFRQEGAQWVTRILGLAATLDEGGAEAVDLVAGFLADPAPDRHPRHRPRMALRLLHLALVAESGPIGVPNDPGARQYVARLREYSCHTGPEAARFPGLLWPVTAYLLDGVTPADVVEMMDEAVANCRAHGGDWELGFTLMLRTHMLVDSAGYMDGLDDDLAELRTLAHRVGERALRAQVCSAAGETAMARGRFTEAKHEYEEALRLAYEVGAYAESPFLIARLGEIAYRAGDRPTALAMLDEATTAADRFGVPDSRAFVCLLRAHMALDDGDTNHARELWRLAREETRRGTPPPHFRAFLDLIDGRVTTVESGPEDGLRKLTAALRSAVEGRCAETVTAAVADSAAAVLSHLGDHARAVRLLAAGTRWRGGHPRPYPEHHEAERTEAAALTALGRTRYDEEHTTGRTYTQTDALDDLTQALRTRRRHSPTHT